MSQHWDPAPDSAEIDAATARLLDTARTLSDADVLAPSLLPGWSRGHVLTHIARNADGLVNLLRWAATGVEHPQYADVGGARRRHRGRRRRPDREQHRRPRGSVTAASSTRVDLVPAENWEHEVRWVSGDPRPAQKILDSRLREVVIHHVDLDAGYSASDWPSAFAASDSCVGAFRRSRSARWRRSPCCRATSTRGSTVSGGSAIEVRGRARQLATWLLGRDSGGSLEWTGRRALPKPPPWT